MCRTHCLQRLSSSARTCNYSRICTVPISKRVCTHFGSVLSGLGTSRRAMVAPVQAAAAAAAVAPPQNLVRDLDLVLVQQTLLQPAAGGEPVQILPCQMFSQAPLPLFHQFLFPLPAGKVPAPPRTTCGGGFRETPTPSTVPCTHGEPCSILRAMPSIHPFLLLPC